jgi:hypothetical protein
MDLMNPHVAGYFIRVTFERIPEIYYCKLRVYIIVSPFPKIQNISYQEVIIDLVRIDNRNCKFKAPM